MNYISLHPLEDLGDFLFLLLIISRPLIVREVKSIKLITGFAIEMVNSRVSIRNMK